MPKYRLLYFDMEGRAEAIRWMFAYANQPYEDERFSYAEWPAKKNEIPYGKVPILYVDGKHIYSTIVICRYLGKVFDLMPADPYQSSVCDEIADGINDILMAAYNVTQAKKKGDMEEFEKLCAEFAGKTLPPVAKALESRLSEHEWYGGEKMSWADLFSAYAMKFVYDASNDLLKNYSGLKSHMEKVVGLPAIQKWLKEKP